MRFFALLASGAAVSAVSLPRAGAPPGAGGGGGGGGGGAGGVGNPHLCPAVWTTISSQLTQVFVSGSQCTDLARAAIRFAFHDAGTFSTALPFYAPAAGGADGSLLLVPSEIQRPENNGLQNYYAFLTSFFANFTGQVTASDLIYFAANHAIVSCPGGPQVATVVGRTDVDPSLPSPQNLMPPGFGPGSDHDSLLALFTAKGFGATDLAALIGAHTASTAVGQVANGIPVGGAQDDTPGIWDVDFYADTYTPPANVFRFDSDVNLSNTSTTVGAIFTTFVGHQAKWQVQFAQAMFKLSLLGVPSATSAGFITCTAALPPATAP